MKKLLVGLFAVAMVFAFTAPAPVVAADWGFYGSARMSTFSESTDAAEGDDNRDTTWGLQGNSRFGAKVKANDNGIGGKFEYGTGVNLRVLYGTWNFGGGTLLIGQDYTPTTEWASNQVWAGDNDLIGYGMAYGGRQPQIKLKVAGFEVALISPATTPPASYTGAGTAPAGADTHAHAITVADVHYAADVETTFPKLELAYKFKTDMFMIKPAFGVNTFNVEDIYGSDESITSYLACFNFAVTPGPFFFNGGVFYASNYDEYGLSGDSTVAALYTPNPVNGTHTFNDVDAWGFQAVAGFKINDGLTVEAGTGMSSYELDADYSSSREDWSYYGNASVTLAPGFFIVPEVGFIDRDDYQGGNDNDTFYVGAKWQINF